MRFAPQQSTEAVSVLGEWNGFQPEAMEKGANGVWGFTRTLDPRDYGYRFGVGTSAAITDPENAFRRWAGGIEHSRLRVADCASPLLEVSKFVAAGRTAGSFEAQAWRGSKGAALGVPGVTLDGVSVGASWDPATGKLGVSSAGLEPGKHRFAVTLADAAGKQAERLYLPFWVEETPFQWAEAILYFVFTDRFRNGDPANDAPTANVEPQANYQGGDFRGVIKSIEEGYFDKLGVRALWLSPLAANPDEAFPGSFGKSYTGYHGYWPSKPREVQFRFGTLFELQELTAAAHKHGIRVIADLVLNHTHQDHPYFRDHKADGWYNISSCICGENNCSFDARPLDCWFTSYLPDFNWRSPAQDEQLVQDALYWLESADLDGFRLDAVKHFDHVGGRNIAGAVNAIADRTGIDFYLVGETFTGSDGRAQIAQYLGPHELDGQFDFPLYWPVIDAFAKGGSLKAVDGAVAANEAFYPAGTLNSPFLGNHDVVRFISTAAGQIDADPGFQAWNNRPPDQVTTDLPFTRLKQAFTFLLTQPGVPLIYYGDEIGLPGSGDPDNRRLMKFGAALSGRESALLDAVQKLGSARKASKALRFGDRTTLLIEDDVYIFQRAVVDEGALVVINRGPARLVSVTLKGEFAKAAPRGYRDVLSGKTLMLGGAAAVSVSLEANTAALYVPAN